MKIVNKTTYWKLLRLQRSRERKHAKRKKVLACRLRVRRKHLAHAAAIAPVEFCQALNTVIHRLVSPEELDLGQNYLRSIEFFLNIRKVCETLKGNIYIDLTSCSRISPAASLFLVAEMDRWRERCGNRRLSPVDIESWNSDVRWQLQQLGFFDLLGAEMDGKLAKPSSGTSATSFMRMCAGHASQGEAARELRIWLESCGIEIADTGALYDGLVEAMTNVEHHAYPKRKRLGGSLRLARWWMTAAAEPATGSFRVLFLDHGQGIPTTLPKQDYWGDIQGWLAKFGFGRANHAQLIEAAIQAKRSRTGATHRGNGLKIDIQGYIEEQEAEARLRIYSNYGRYEYHKMGNSGRSMCTGLPKFLPGTFLEWTIFEARK